MDLMAITSEAAPGEAVPGEGLVPAAVEPDLPPFAAVLGRQVEQLLELLASADAPQLQPPAVRPEIPAEDGQTEDEPADAAACSHALPMLAGAETAVLPQGLDALEAGRDCAGSAPAAKAPEADILTGGQAVAADPAVETPKRRPGLESFTDTFPAGWEELFQTESEAPKTAAAKPLPAEATGQALAPRDPGVTVAENAAGAGVEQDANPAQIGPQVGNTDTQQPTAAGKANSEAEAPDHARDSGYAAGKRVMAREDTATEGTMLHSQLRVESSRETASLPAAGGSSAKPSLQTSWTPAQILTRMSEVQKQMVVEHFAHASTSAMSRGGNDSVWVDLYPPELGRVRVLVESSGQQVNAVLTVQDPSVRDMFQEQMAFLRRGLEESGLKLGQLSVEIRQDARPDARPEAETAAKRISTGWESKVPAAVLPRTWNQAWSQDGSGRVDMMI